MKSFVFFGLLLLASACVFARAEEETSAVDDAPKMEDQPEIANAVNDEEQADEEQADEEQADEEETEEDEEESEDDEDEETEEDETTDVADDEPEKRGWKCRNYRKGGIRKLWCRECGCRPVCRPRWCKRRVCKRVRCGTRVVCRTVYRTRKYKYFYPIYRGYGPRFVWKTKRVPHRVCVKLPKFCTRCHSIRYQCGKICKNICRYRKCSPVYRG
ncbi:putative E3 ubiquitin-protein ligase RING1a isoform X2 [Dendronephthya gigantea]|uniref:putative E3 ubiquitin-protein ligase RING1a isoform X2 n=1 Tax=Dendronephthya gigantea TaxID=151771 RepID=UPI0010693FA5|nr:putative E3 ubiquitin-protein ligase RING1a isoform X2 [Dendronephthya gigantea]